MTPGRPRPVVDSGGSALAGANGITVVVHVSAHLTRLGVVACGVPRPPILALAAQSGREHPQSEVGLDIQRAPSAPRTRRRRGTGDGTGVDEAPVAPAGPVRRKSPLVR